MVEITRMCGIYITNINFTKENVLAKINLMRYRGPDNLGFSKVGDISIAHLRLAILDLDRRSNQPYVFDGLYITYNGEIYNFLSIREELIKLGYKFETTSDTEVLIKGYKEWGKGILTKLNGMFAFAIYDFYNQQIFCARDRMGVKPFYYYWKDGLFEISSQLSPLMKSDSKISQEAVSIYLDCGYIPSPFSILKDVFKLSPGNYMLIDLNTKCKQIESYWKLKPVSVLDIDYKEARSELHKLITDAVKIRMQSDVPIGSFLSGGIDSALITSIASKLSSTKINTFTIGFQDPKFDESKVAKQFAEVIGSNHSETVCNIEDVLDMLPMLVEVYDEPFADSSALPSLLLNKVAKQHVTVALAGDGGDESFLGYKHFDSLRKFLSVNRVPWSLRRLSVALGAHHLLGGNSWARKMMLNVRDDDEFIWKVFNGFDSLQKTSYDKLKKIYGDYRNLSYDSMQKMADLNMRLWLENDSNVKVDRASMASSLEVRSPFLDYRIVEFARMLPVTYRYNNGMKKRIVKDILSEYIPPHIFDLPKKGFSVPLAAWLRKELRQDVVKNLNDDFLYNVPNLDVQKFKSRMRNFLEGKGDHTFAVWKLYVLSLWYNRYRILI